MDPTESASSSSPPRLIVYVNPHSGTKRALTTYKSKLETELQSRDNVTVVFTEFPGHCMEHVKNLDIKSSRLHIVTISGDGLFFEALNGLNEREDWEENKDNVSMGIIPCGTGNALACSMAKRSNEPFEGDCGLSVALRNVLKGRSTQPLDLIEVDLGKEKKKVMSFIGVTIGLIADVDIGTEHLRWMGYLRAYIMVAWRILMPKAYTAKVSYLPLEKDSETGRPLPVAKGSRLNMPSLDDPSLPEGWVTETSSYYLIYADNLPLLDSVTLLAPDSKLDDGIVYLVLVRFGMTRRDMLDWLLHTPSGRHSSKSEVDIIPVRAFRIEPIKPEGYLSVDGESFQFGGVQGEFLTKLRV